MKIERKEIITKDGKKVLQVTTQDERWYLVDKIYYPSVTWILAFYHKSPRLVKWIADKGWDEAEQTKNEAAEKGSRIHHACSDILRGKEIPHDAKYPNSTGEVSELSVEEYEAVMSFAVWLKEAQPEIIANEYTVINKKDGYAGTVDLKCKIKGETWIIDLKTGQGTYPSYALQVSAYRHADPVDKIGILQVGYQRNQSRYKFTEVQDKYPIFLATKQIWDNEVSEKNPPQKDYPLSVKWEKPKKVVKKVVRRKHGKNTT